MVRPEKTSPYLPVYTIAGIDTHVFPAKDGSREKTKGRIMVMTPAGLAVAIDLWNESLEYLQSLIPGEMSGVLFVLDTREAYIKPFELVRRPVWPSNLFAVPV